MNIQEHVPQKFQYNFKKPDGSYFRTNIDILGKVISEMTRGYSPIIAIVGKQRSGKSFFGVWFSNHIHGFFHDEPFDPTRLTFYDPATASTRIDESTQEPIFIDEAGAIYNKQEWYEKVTRAMSKILQTQGFRSNCYIFVAPFGNDIVKDFRKHFDYICHTMSRGHIVVKKVVKKYDEINDVKIKTHFYEKVIIKRTDLDPDVWAKYDTFSIVNKKDMHGDYTRVAVKSQATPDPFGRERYGR